MVAIALLTILPSYPPANAHGQAPDPVAILDRAARVYATAGGMQAQFRQVIDDPMIGTFRSRGHLAQRGPDKFAMRFTDPRGEALVMDGTKLWVYTPSTTPGQVLRMPQPIGPGAPNLVAWLLDRPSDRYFARWIGSDTTRGGADILILTPRDSTLPFSSATVAFARTNGLPRRIEITERRGTRRTLSLSRVRDGHRIRASTFRFSVPSGVRVVDQ